MDQNSSFLVQRRKEQVIFWVGYAVEKYHDTGCDPSFSPFYRADAGSADHSGLRRYGLLVVDFQVDSEGGPTVDDAFPLHDVV